ncbi:MAG: type II secretion system protein, partial [Caldisericaceae bacterium]
MNSHSGFTLIELVVIAAILVLLSFYAIPKFYELAEEARSSQAQAQVGTVRSALGIYYAK